MLDLLPALDRWRAAGRRTALATVISTWGSAPRPPGSKLAIGAGGEMAGSVSGGCVEGAVVEEARGVLADQRPRLVRFGVADDDAFAVGLSCGGTLEVWIEPLDGPGADPALDALRAALEARRPVARATVVGAAAEAPDDAARAGTVREDTARTDPGPDPGATVLLDGAGEPVAGSLDPATVAAVQDAARALRPAFGARRLAAPGGRDVFVEWLPPPPRLVIVGAVHTAVALVAMARTVGFETHVVDPRTAFATAERFGHADHLRHDWPDEALEHIGVDENTFVALLSHDLKLDVPALRVALPRARYVGAVGSRRTHRKRLAAAREAGVGARWLERVHNPIGLDLGGRRAEEMAVAVLAEIVAVRHGRDGRRERAR